MDYKKYSLENLENWLHDAMSAGEATPAEVYNTIKKVVEEQYYHHKHHAGQAYELLALLNGNGIGHIKAYDDCVDKILSCDKDDPSPECKGAWNDFWVSNSDVEYDLREAEYYNNEKTKYVPEGTWMYNVIEEWEQSQNDVFNNVFDSRREDKVVKWQLPVQVDDLTGDCYIELPDDLLEVAGLKEGDTVEWIDRGDGSFEMRKV